MTELQILIGCTRLLADCCVGLCYEDFGLQLKRVCCGPIEREDHVEVIFFGNGLDIMEGAKWEMF